MGGNTIDGTVVYGIKEGNIIQYAYNPSGNSKKFNVRVIFSDVGAINSWKEFPSIEDWTYGESAKETVCEAAYGRDTMTVTYDSKRDGTFEQTEVPTDAGTYYAKISIAETNEYSELEEIVEFSIFKADPSITAPSVETTYGAILSDMELPAGFEWADDTQNVGDIGKKIFKATFIPEDTDNYNILSDIEIKVSVAPKASDTLAVPDITVDTDLDTVQIKDGDKVLVKDKDYTVKKTVNGNKVTVIFEFRGNYERTRTVEYILEEKPVVDPSEKTDAGNRDNDSRGVDESSPVKTGDTEKLSVWMLILAAAVMTGAVARHKEQE